MDSRFLFSCGSEGSAPLSDECASGDRSRRAPEPQRRDREDRTMTETTTLVGKNLGPYRIIAPCGSGGYAQVYKAADATMNRTVALKVLRPEIAEQEGFLEQLTLEELD